MKELPRQAEPTRLFPGDECDLLLIGAPPFNAAVRAKVERMELISEPSDDTAAYIDADPPAVPGIVAPVQTWFDQGSGDSLEVRVGFERLMLTWH